MFYITKMERIFEIPKKLWVNFQIDVKIAHFKAKLPKPAGGNEYYVGLI
jgi:hypothetical protein